MSHALAIQFISPEDYLDGELYSEVRHEYVDGYVHAMSGGSEQHNLLALTLASHLRSHLRGRPCRVFINDMKVQIKTLHDERYYYPDVMVTCQTSDNQRYFKQYPQLIIEVLSNSTERFDRFEKFATYQKLATLEEYVLVAQSQQQVEVYRRQDNWQPVVYKEVETVKFETVELTLPLKVIYEDIHFE